MCVCVCVCGVSRVAAALLAGFCDEQSTVILSAVQYVSADCAFSLVAVCVSCGQILFVVI